MLPIKETIITDSWEAGKVKLEKIYASTTGARTPDDRYGTKYILTLGWPDKHAQRMTFSEENFTTLLQLINEINETEGT